MKPSAVGALVVYVAAIVAANVATDRWGLVPVGFGLLVTAGTFAAGFALLARDVVQRTGGQVWVAVGIAAGGVLSWFLANPALAVASVLAFTVSEVVDWGVFTRAAGRGFIAAALLSGVIAAPVDTVLFLWVAGFPLTWPVVLGQFLGKVVWATLVPLAIYAGVTGAVPRQPVNATDS